MKHIQWRQPWWCDGGESTQVICGDLRANSSEKKVGMVLEVGLNSQDVMGHGGDAAEHSGDG